MKANLSELKDVCSKLSVAFDSNKIDAATEAIEIRAEGNTLLLSLTNFEYFVTATMPLIDADVFHATINAEVFMRLVSQITTDIVEITIAGNCVVVSADGKYKLPLIFDGDSMLELPSIDIENVSKTFTVPTESLRLISTYNSRELSKGVVAKPVQKMYYVDNKGCITFTSGACVTYFKLDEDVKMLLSAKIVNLLKCFKDTAVTLSIGEDVYMGTVQPKLSISDSRFMMVAHIPATEALIGSVPVPTIRSMAASPYDYTAVVDTRALASAVKRMLLFMPKDTYSQPYGNFEFGADSVRIYDRTKTNVEEIKYADGSVVPEEAQTVILDFNDVDIVLDVIRDDNVTIKYGNSVSVLIQRPDVVNIIPECVI